ncbi:MAG: sigma-54-dependent Fis family transcriptional regulator [Rhodocyclaceae bacterium]|nr:sigma-54-dependent Fis family transcriptional regulator [Rhodocyclaceae bacterium]
MSSSDRRNRATTPEILVVDDEDDIRELIELSLLRLGLACDTAGTVGEARALLADREYRLCLTDMRLPDGDGLELVEYIQATHVGLPVAVITAYGSMDAAIRALKGGAFDFVSKPIELKALRELVSHALRLDGADEPAATGGKSLIGRSLAVEQLRIQIAKLARNQAPVFIHGESGTGKEVIARLIHEQGPRAGAPFIPVNCGAISPELMESEFFGHRKGSFTGASVDKEGLFQAARGGTLFLDEVGELPLGMQVKLLRAIQERAVRPVGGHAEEPVDVRILSASHRDLAQLVEQGKFRQDLFYRINVITLRSTPLRERPEDIPELAAHILAKLARREGGAVRRLSRDALDYLVQHPLPGNVRELENLLERACALADADIVDREDLSGGDPWASASGGVRAPLTHPAPHEVAPALTPRPAEVPPAMPGEGDDDAERASIMSMLEETHWNRSEAARRLGMTLRQLRYRLQKWGVE